MDFLGSRVDVQGHRGARAWMPENTISAFLKALYFGVDTLELDVVVSGDGQIVVSHEPYMNSLFCIQPNGVSIEDIEAQRFNIYQMDYNQIKKFDCGIKTNPNFPQQQSISAYKPLLSEVIEVMERASCANIKYNIEIKSEPYWDNLFQPSPENFVKMLFKVLDRYSIQERYILQSFDVRVLQEIKKQRPLQMLAYLVENNKTLNENLEQLGFMPNIYSPEFILIDKSLLIDLNRNGIKLITWTVNEESDILRMLEYGVNGIISDYPDRVIKLLKSFKNDKNVFSKREK